MNISDTFLLILESQTPTLYHTSIKVENAKKIKEIILLELLSKHHKQLIRNHNWYILTHIDNDKILEHITNNYKFKNIITKIVKKYNFLSDEKIKTDVDKYGKFNIISMTNNLYKNDRRNQFILNIIKELYNQKKRILCISYDGNLTELLCLQLEGYDIGKFMPGIKEKKLRKSIKKQIVFASYVMIEEHPYDINTDVIIFLTSRKRIECSIDLIKGINKCMFIDFNDNNKIFNKRSEERDKYYEEKKYLVQNFYVRDYKKIEI